MLITFLNEPKLIYEHIVKCFSILLCITNNSIKHQSFVYTQLNDQTVLFLTIQFSIRHLFVLSLNVKVLFDPYIGPFQALPLRVRVGLRAMAIKEHSTFLNFSITGALSSDLVWNPENSFREGSYPSVEIQLMYSTAPVN